MSRKQKWLFSISVATNIILVIVVAWGYIQINFAAKQLLVTEVEVKLIELEALIAQEIEGDWTEPNLVTMKLGDALDSLWVGMKTAEQLNSISSKEKQSLYKLFHKLQAQYPQDSLYSFTDVSEQDIEHFIELREFLREVGFGIGIQSDDDYKHFMAKVDTLIEKIEGQQLRE